MAEQIWYKDLSSFMSKRTALRFFPSSTMTVQSQLNAILRFCIYYSLLASLLTRNPRHMLVGFLGAVITVVIHEVAYSGRNEPFRSLDVSGRECVEPTQDNPMMNFNVFDPPERAPACKPWNVEKQMDTALGEPLQDTPHQNTFNRFYTMPSTTVSNDQKGFANWLYGSMPAKGTPPSRSP